MDEADHHHRHQQKLQSPQLHNYIEWDSNEIKEASQKSRAALKSLKALIPTSTDALVPCSTADHLQLDSSMDHELNFRVENLFLVDGDSSRGYHSYGLEEQRDWGNKDVLIDLTDSMVTREKIMEYLLDAANFSGGTVCLINLRYTLDEDENKAFVDALSVGAVPKRLLISNCSFDVYDLLRALEKCKDQLTCLSLQYMVMSDVCIEVLHRFTSLTDLHLQEVITSPDFVGRLADLHLPHSPLAASLQRLYIDCINIPWSRAASAFMEHWPQLKELNLRTYPKAMSEEDLIMTMEQYLAAVQSSSKRKLQISASDSDHHSASSVATPQLNSLRLGLFEPNRELSRRAIAAVVDAISASGLPFLQLWTGVPYYITSDANLKETLLVDPSVEAQLLRNKHLLELGDFERVPTTSIRLFICGDPYAGKTTLLSTLYSIYTLKRNRWRNLVPCCGDYIKPDRTQGIEVRTITKDGIRISLWDMAGQQEFHAFHDYMFPDIGTSSSNQAPSLFMFVWSPAKEGNTNNERDKTERDFETSFRYWLKFLASKTRKSNIALKVIIVFTHADQVKLINSAVSGKLKSLQNEFREIIDILIDHTFEVDARKEDSVKHVGAYTFEIARQMLQGAEMYDICTQVSEYLSEHAKVSEQRIITWSQFSRICMDKLYIPGDAEPKLHAIALSLTESGVLIYVNRRKHLILDPNWFCNYILGSLIYFPECNAIARTMVIQGFTNRRFLEDKLELVSDNKVKGSLLVDLMEEMHLCCKVPTNLARSYGEDCLFIPATLSGHSQEPPKWKLHYDQATCTYVGRRLVCENNDLNFLTPGLFPRIQVLFSCAFQDINATVELGKNFISICVLTMEIIVVFCQAKADYVLDVLVQAPNNIGQDHLTWALAYVEDHIIDTLVRVCAQPKGIQGVKLIENVLRPDILKNPSIARDREDQYVEVTYLKQLLRQYLEQGIPQYYVWRKTMSDVSINTSLFDLLGYKNYSEVFTSYKAWLEEVHDGLLEKDNALSEHGKTSKFQPQGHHNVNVQPSSENNQNPNIIESTSEEHQILGEEVEVLFTKNMAKAIFEEILKLHNKMDTSTLSLHNKMDEMRMKLDDVHKEVISMREDVLGKVQRALDKVLDFAMGNEAAMQLPRLVILRTNGVHKVRELVMSLSRRHILYVRVELYCENRKSPHRVEKQPGITLTSLSEPLSENLEKALPYINGVVWILTTAAKMALSSMAPQMGSFIPDIKLPQPTVGKEYPMITNTIRSGNALSFSRVCTSTSHSYREWQRCFKAMLTDKYGPDINIEKTIDKDFHLRPAIYKDADGSDQVAWLCKEHYKAHMIN